MHELSLATAVFDLARQHTPAGAIVRCVKLRAGPMRGVEPTAMQWAWASLLPGTELEHAELELEILPWTLHCPACSRQWQSDELFVPCSCGYERPNPVGGDELQLISLTVDDSVAPPPAEPKLS